jgi:hypothetical protein
MNRIKSLIPSPAIVIAMIALFAALAGTSYAALARNSVTTIQVKDRSLLAKDFKSGQLPRGATGAPGPAGPAGPAGPTGPAGAAKAYARVLAGGDVDDPRARGITDASVSHPSAGVYCIDVDGGAINVSGTIDSAAPAPGGTFTAGVLLNTCPAGKEVEVKTYSGGAPTDLPFYLLVN